jgi:hypothetical protein
MDGTALEHVGWEQSSRTVTTWGESTSPVRSTFCLSSFRFLETTSSYTRSINTKHMPLPIRLRGLNVGSRCFTTPVTVNSSTVKPRRRRSGWFGWSIDSVGSFHASRRWRDPGGRDCW